MSFTTDDATDAVMWLLKHRVPSLSPETSKLLLEVSSLIEKLLETEKTISPGVREVLDIYRRQMYLVSVFSHLHQGAVIAQLELLVGEARQVAKGME
jgi:hypothetical protein